MKKKELKKKLQKLEKEMKAKEAQKRKPGRPVMFDDGVCKDMAKFAEGCRTSTLQALFGASRPTITEAVRRGKALDADGRATSVKVGFFKRLHVKR